VGKLYIIEYLKHRSFLHRFDPRTKIVCIFLLTLILFIVKQPFVIAGLLFSFIVLWMAAKMPFAKIKSYAKHLFPLMVFITVMQVLFGPGERYLDGLLFGGIISLRIAALILLLPMLTMTTPIDKLALGFTRMGLPYKGAYIITTAINLIPAFEDEARFIMDAQKIRGMRAFEGGTILDKFRAYPALAVPLIIGAMRRAQMMRVAMDARGFGAFPIKTYLEDLRMSAGDYFAVMVVVAFSVLALILNSTLQGIL
jgi:energy-coupling factor transport system permease protein